MAYRKMDSSAYPILERFLDIYRDNPVCGQHQARLQAFSSSPPASHDIDTILNTYETAISITQADIRTAHPTDAAITLYQQLYQELETFLSSQGEDQRHKFVIVIPVADRPRHLQSCLQSILSLCRSFHYGGCTNKVFPKVAVIIADDTKDETNVLRHKKIAHHFNTQGIETIYFGLEEQQQQLHCLSETERQLLAGVLGDISGTVPPHKGPSIMRNITYLKLNEMCKTNDNLLFHFIDSDQEFQVKTRANGEERNVYAINYFYELDRIFSCKDISIVTGKVVGDPPVSPAVMTGTFLDDIITFLHRIALTEPDLACQFHGQYQQKEYDAAYHDMAELFGFKPSTEAYHYHCNLSGKHDQAACFANFASQLNQFFHGEHPTRKSYFNHEIPLTDTVPARTIYTGNYIFNVEQLKYFIPFARLKLRMAGPVLGRIIKAECKDRFVSANLPMLHNRTVEDIGKSEFRPGINNECDKIDLSVEFERQYFGDVMLFSMEKLTALGYPAQPVTEQTIIETLESTEKDMRHKYATKQNQIHEKLELLKAIFFDEQNWWNTIKNIEPARENFRQFITNIEQNFSTNARGYELIDAETNRTQRFKEMREAILKYPAERKAWQAILGSH